MTLIRPDGTEGDSHELVEGDTSIGRDHGELFESDGYLSPSHAVISVQGDVCRVRDLGSLNGVFVRMMNEEEIASGQIFRVGQELLRFDQMDAARPLEDGTEIMGSPNPGYWGRVTVIIGEDCDGASYPLASETISIGRERGDITFPDDGYVSGLHAQVSTRDGQFFISDMGSSNGTFMKVSGERELPKGSFVLFGQQLFRIDF
jgi:pSer/pThr/pTyr-binding forkhead associated (FHA) protein